MANISWMYKNLGAEAVTITETFGTSNSDYGTANLIDNNLKTTWNMGRIALEDQSYASIVFDMGSSVYVDSLVVIHNSNSGTMYFLASDTTSFNFFDESPLVIGDTPYVLSDSPLNYGNAISGVYGLPILGSTGTSVHFIPTPANYRYWGLFIGGTSFTEIVKVNEVFIGQRDVFPINPQYPFKKERDSSTIVTESEKGQKKVYHKYSRNKWTFQYPAIDDALYGTMNKIRNHVSGSYKPFFMCIDKDDAPLETYFVRFVNNTWKHSEVYYGVHDVEFTIEEEL